MEKLVFMMVILVLFPGFAGTDQTLATREEFVAGVRKAVNLVAQKRVDAVIGGMSDSNGPLVRQGFGLFVIDPEYKYNLANPANPGLFGKYRMAITDSTDRMVFDKRNRVTEGDGADLVTYELPQSNEKKPFPKESCVMRVPDTGPAVLAGVYRG